MKYKILLSLILGIFLINLASALMIYTPTTKTNCNENKVCNQIIYSSTQFVQEDGQWIDYTKVKSLKDKEGFEISFLEQDKDYPIAIKDFNATSITLDLKQWTLWGKDVRVRTWEKNNSFSGIARNYKDSYILEKDIIDKVTFWDLGSKEVTYNFGVGKILEIGDNSTSVQLTSSSILVDGTIRTDFPNTPLPSAPYAFYNVSGIRREVLMKWNITTIPGGATINSAYMQMTISAEGMEAGDSNSVATNSIYNNYSMNTSVTWNLRPPSDKFNSTYEYFNTFTDGASGSKNWTIINALSYSIGSSADNMMLWLKVNSSNLDGVDDFIEFDSATETFPPILFINYTSLLAPVVTLNSPINAFNSSSGSITFNCSATGTITNVSLYINNILNTTNTSGVSGIYLFTKTLLEGNKNWTCGSCNTGGCVNATTRNLTIDTIKPALQITYPTATIYGTNITIFNWTATDTHLSICLYNYDLVANASVTCGDNSKAISLASGTHTIRMYANDTFGNMNSSSVTFTMDADAPSITLNSPVDNLKSITASIIFNCTGADNIGLANVSLYINNILNATNTPANNTPTTFSKTLIDGTHTWNCQACDNLGYCVNGSARNLLIDTVNPTISIIYPTPINYSIVVTTFNTTQMDTNLDICWYSLNNGITNTTFTCNTNITGLVANQGNNTWKVWANDTFGRINSSSVTFNVNSTPLINIQSPYGFLGLKTINYSIDLNYTAINPDLDSCWYSIDGGINVSLPGCNNQTIIIFDLIPIHSIIVYANDTFGNIGSSNSNWTILTDNSVTYSSPIVSSDYANFTANFSLGTSPTNVLFNYNNLNYTPSISVDGYDYIITNNLNVPNVSVDTNFSFYYIFTINGNDYISNSRNQTVQTIIISTICNNVTFIYPILNLTNYGEEDTEITTLINGTVDYDFNIINNGVQIAQFNGTSNGTVIHICTNHNLSASSGALNLQLRYYAPGYMFKTYNIQNGSLSSIPFNINLYYLNNTIGNSFIINYVDFNYLEHPGAIIQIQREYLSLHTFYVVEIPVIADNGGSQANFNTHNIRYKLIVIEKGKILDIFNNVFPICQSPILGTCVLDLRGNEVITPGISEDFTYTLNKSGNIVSLTYIIPSGTSRTVRLTTVQNSRFIDGITNCNQSIFASGGTINCAYNNTIGDSEINVQINTGTQTLYGTLGVAEDLQGFFLLNNYVIAFIMLLTLVLMFISSSAVMLIISVIGLIYLGLIFLLKGVNITVIATSLVWLVIAIVLALIKISNKEEKT